MNPDVHGTTKYRDGATPIDRQLPSPDQVPGGKPADEVDVVPSGLLRLLGRSAAAVLAAAVLATAGDLAAGGIAGADSTGAGAGGGTVSVGAGSGGAGGGSAGGGAGGSGGGSSSGGGGPASPWSCVYTYLALNNQGGFPPGGPLPGAWYSVTCVDAAAGQQVTQTVWVTGTAPAPGPTVDPHALALQAENAIQLPRPSLRTDPAGTSVVNLATWLWIDPSIWHDEAVTASAGAVSATAVAHPVAVRWSTGDGGVVVCQGPGTAYVWWLPAAVQSTSCSHEYLRTSAGQPTLDGDPDHGTYVVTASIDWAVSWSSVGVPGGGALPALLTSDATLVRVAQVESVNTVPGAVRPLVVKGLGA
jgi:hypothetical protein